MVHTWVEAPEFSTVGVANEAGEVLARMENPGALDPESVDYLGRRKVLVLLAPDATLENAAERCLALYERHCVGSVMTEDVPE